MTPHEIVRMSRLCVHKLTWNIFADSCLIWCIRMPLVFGIVAVVAIVVRMCIGFFGPLNVWKRSHHITLNSQQTYEMPAHNIVKNVSYVSSCCARSVGEVRLRFARMFGMIRTLAGWLAGTGAQRQSCVLFKLIRFSLLLGGCFCLLVSVHFIRGHNVLFKW